jgi:tetratricopeptide (TPR) repeat protein
MELGRNLRFLQVYDDAIKEFTFANTLNPSDPEPDYFIARTYATIGEYEKALQYAEAAMNDRPTDPRYRGNYGVMFYRNFRYTDAVRELGLAVNGGTTEDGFPIQKMELTNDPRVAEFYFTYGLALARTNQCGQALPIAQTLQTEFPTDDIVLEAANAMITICQENLDNPAVDTPVPSEEATPEATPEATLSS